MALHRRAPWRQKASTVAAAGVAALHDARGRVLMLREGAGRRSPRLRKTRSRIHVSEKWAWLLLHRYGVVFRDLLEPRVSCARAGANWCARYRRLEMRATRFVADALWEDVAGEQFALPEAVAHYVRPVMRRILILGRSFQPWTL